MKKLFFLIALITSLNSKSTQAAPIKIDIFFSQDNIRPSDNFWMAIKFTIEGGYHIYSADTNADIGIPTKIIFPKIHGLRFKEPIFPKPIEKELPELGGKVKLYEYEFTVFVQAAIDEKIELKKISIPLTLDYGLCTDKTCEPHFDEIFTTSIAIVKKDSPLKLTHEEIFGKFLKKEPQKTNEPKPDPFKEAAMCIGPELLPIKRIQREIKEVKCAIRKLITGITLEEARLLLRKAITRHRASLVSSPPPITKIFISGCSINFFINSQYF